MKKYSISSFSKLHKIPIKTLRYYDDINLFSPKWRGENKYRYYSEKQNFEFEYIKLLKKLGLTLNEIKEYRISPSEDEFEKLANKKIIEIENEIKQLNEMKYMFDYRISLLNEYKKYKNNIFIEEINKDYYFKRSDNISNIQDHQLFNFLTKQFGLDKIYNGISCMTNIENNDIKYLYFLVPENTFKDNDKIISIKPGKYLSYFYIGNWNKLNTAYQHIKKYTEHNNINLKKNGFEFSVNDIMNNKAEEQIIKIMIPLE